MNVDFVLAAPVRRTFFMVDGLSNLLDAQPASIRSSNHFFNFGADSLPLLGRFGGTGKYPSFRAGFCGPKSFGPFPFLLALFPARCPSVPESISWTA